MYGFRHPKLHAGSFYVKTSLRKASNEQSELLAVGSTDGGPVLFPTDEAFLKRVPKHDEDDDADLPGITTRSKSQASTTNARCTDSIPIYEQGTSLVRGHSAEVTSVCWATNGSLVSVSDDLCVRRWKEGREARELRLGGESEGRRWQCGWADMAEGYDDDE
jgi:WD40 repeat protein